MNLIDDGIHSLVSVALPVVKVKFLNEAIESVLNQTYKNLELIILNNGKSLEDKQEIKIICGKHTDNRIHYFENNVQLPIIENWKRCLSLANGDLFSLLCDDDKYEPEFIGELAALAARMPDTHVFHCRIRKIDENGKTVTYGPSLPEHENVINSVWHAVKGFRLQFVSEFMCRTRKLRDIGGFYPLPFAWGSDYITWFTLAEEGGIGFVNKPLCNWRTSTINISSAGNIEERILSVSGYKSWFGDFMKRIRPSDDTEKDMILEINNSRELFFNNKILNLLLQLTSGRNIFSSCFAVVRYQRKLRFDSLLTKKIILEKLKQILR